MSHISHAASDEVTEPSSLLKHDATKSTGTHGDASVERKDLWVMPALAIGIFLSAADQTIVVSSYGHIGSDLKALNSTGWLATGYLNTVH